MLDQIKINKVLGVSNETSVCVTWVSLVFKASVYIFIESTPKLSLCEKSNIAMCQFSLSVRFIPSYVGYIFKDSQLLEGTF